jgi:hypothetical protein
VSFPPEIVALIEEHSLGRRTNLAVIALSLAILIFALFSIGCGNYNYTGFGTNGTVTGGTGSGATGLPERAFVSDLNPNAGNAAIQVVDAGKDLPALNSNTLQPFTVSIGGACPPSCSPPLPTLMISGANNTTIVFNSGDNGISVVDNSTEALIKKLGTTDCTQVNCEFQLPGPATSLAESSDGKFIYAAIPTKSQVTTIPLTATTITPTSTPQTPLNCQATNSCLPGADRIVLSHNNNLLLVFDEQLPSQFEVINTAASPMTVQTVSAPGQLDHPAYGVFSSDDSKAYILNCGAECGGAQASVAVLNTSGLTISQVVNVDAATIGATDNTNLYVAGTNPASSSGGSLSVLPLSGLAVAKQISIGNGFHQVISLFQNKVIVGAKTCTTGCMSLVDPNAGTAIVDLPKGDVTAITNITPRTVFYTAEGGEVRVYDVSTGTEHLNNNTPVIDVVGQVTSVLYVGPKS